MDNRAWRVVLADDNGDCLEMLEVLAREVFGPLAELRCASDGEEAHRILCEAPCDLLVTDYNMPRLDGGRLVARLAGEGRLKGMAVLVVSGGIDAARDPLLRAAGVDRLLEKPFTFEQFRTAVLAAVGGQGSQGWEGGR